MKAILACSILLAALSFPLAVDAAASGGFGVTPVRLDFTDPPLLRGSVAEGGLRLQNSDATPTFVTLVPEGALADWVTIDGPSELTLEPGSTRTLRVSVAVPTTAPNGEHAGHLRIRARGSGEPAGSGATTQVELLPAIRVLVTGEQVVAFTLEQVAIEDPAIDAPVVVAAEILNRGNVRETPRLDVLVRDATGREVLRETLTAHPIAPATKQRVELATSRGLPQGLYTARVSLPAELGGEGSFSIDIESRRGGATTGPALTPAGDLVDLEMPEGATPGALASFVARFANDGTAPIASAKLTLEVFRGEERVAVVTSDALRAGVGETLALDAFWEPDAPGEHTLKAYVTYDGIRTPVRQAAFLVAGPDAAADATTPGAPGTQPPTPEAPVPGPGPALLLALVGALAWSRRQRT